MLYCEDCCQFGGQGQDIKQDFLTVVTEARPSCTQKRVCTGCCRAQTRFLTKFFGALLTRKYLCTQLLHHQYEYGYEM
jgi:hypothetical protein